ncbi:MAG: hypothetical protein Q8N84_02070, partial [bacterium]|nr:hypothetical protein [bacterium]
LTSSSTLAVTSEEMQKLSDRLRDNATRQKELQDKLTELTSQATTLKNQISYMDNQVYLTTLKIEEALTLIEEKAQETVILQGEIGDLAARITRLGGALQFQQEILGRRAREKYKSSRFTAFELLFGAQSFGEMLQRAKYLAVMENQDRSLLEQIKVTKADYHGQKLILEDKKEKVEKLKAEIERQKTILEARKVDLDNQKVAKQELLAVTKNDEDRFQSMLAESRAEQAAIESALSQFTAGLITGAPEGTAVKRGDIIGIQGSTGYSTGDHVHFGVYTKCGESWCYQNPHQFIDSGQLTWPLDSFQISQEYGATPEAQYMYASKFHNGIDIYGPINSPVKAGGDGKLSYSIDSKGGKGAIIIHNDNLMSIYWHFK